MAGMKVKLDTSEADAEIERLRSLIDELDTRIEHLGLREMIRQEIRDLAMRDPSVFRR